ncbi:uncharacterized protein A4U43_C06F6870 [Asparagus officinalis]|uniref:Uncharacterized protein n=1 Tax=Asparagus officinalis TaxID=4686 RepID=A0A5P1EK39_ASPOF|nr:uncharacterized protein LOC109844956 [Asparagus officinalis]ONK66355.1 uncharacterized protein A4U43_C06F6870 [Asparagus officinalis]
MDATLFSFSSSIRSAKLSTNPTRYPTVSNQFHLRKNLVKVRSASKQDGYGYEYGLVDQNMIVLRKRMEELRMTERLDQDPTEEWTEWEKNYYRSCYVSDVCQAVGLIQMFAMSVRPGVALGLVGLILLSVPVSVILIAIHLCKLRVAY